MASNGTVFRSQIGGFNREDVNNYIKEADMKYSAQIESLKADLDKAAEKIKSLTEDSEKALHEKEAAEAALEEANRRIEEAENSAKEIGILLSGKDIELSSAKEKAAQLEATVGELRAELENRPAEDTASSEELTARIGELTDLVNEKDEIIVSLNDEIERLNSANAVLTRAPGDEAGSEPQPEPQPEQEQEQEPEPDHESAAYKLRMYDKISSQIGDILINANRSADDIVTSAKREAEKITSELAEESVRNKEKVKAEADRLVGRMHEIYSGTAESLSSEIRTDAENCINELNLFVENMQYELQGLISKISGSRDEILDRLTFFHRNSTEEIQRKLNETGALFSSLTDTGEQDEQ